MSVKIRTTTTDSFGGNAAIEEARGDAARLLGAAPDQISLLGTTSGHTPADDDQPEHWWFESTWAHMP